MKKRSLGCLRVYKGDEIVPMYIWIISKTMKFQDPAFNQTGISWFMSGFKVAVVDLKVTSPFYLGSNLLRMRGFLLGGWDPRTWISR